MDASTEIILNNSEPTVNSMFYAEYENLQSLQSYNPKQLKNIQEILDKPIYGYNFSNTYKKNNLKIEVSYKDVDGKTHFRRIIINKYTSEKTEFIIEPFPSNIERNKTIYHLYKNEKYSQIFLSGCFCLSQSQISRIIRTEAEKCGEQNKKRNLRAFSSYDV